MKIESTKSVTNSGLFCLIAGESGVGKTRLASTLRGRTLIISTEEGLLSLSEYDIDAISVVGATAEARLTHLSKSVAFAMKSDYENIFIDSLSEIGELFEESQIEKKITGFEKWGNIKNSLQKLIKYCRDSNKNIFFTTLIKVEVDETIGKRSFVPDIPTGLKLKAPSYFDEVFHMKSTIKDDKVVRYFQTVNDGKFHAKDRSGKLNAIEKADLGIIQDKITGIHDDV